MAYLKDTYIDGNLYVDGALRVRVLEDPTVGNLPYLYDEDSSQENRLAKFYSTDGALHSSYLRETISNDILEYSVDTNSNEVNLNIGNANIFNLFKDNTIDQYNIKIDVDKTTVINSDLTELKSSTSSIKYTDPDGNTYAVLDTHESGQTIRTVWPDAFYFTSLLG